MKQPLRKTFARRGRALAAPLALLLALGAAGGAAADEAPAAAPAPAAEAEGAAPAATAAQPAEPAASAVPSRRPRHRAHTASIDDRLAVLGAELKLDAKQRDAVRRILESQRTQMQRVWSDASVPAALRVKSTQAIGDRTAEQIRAVLNDEQRARYIQPLPPDARATTTAANVEKYMATPARR